MKNAYLPKVSILSQDISIVMLQWLKKLFCLSFKHTLELWQSEKDLYGVIGAFNSISPPNCHKVLIFSINLVYHNVILTLTFLQIDDPVSYRKADHLSFEVFFSVYVFSNMERWGLKKETGWWLKNLTFKWGLERGLNGAFTVFSHCSSWEMGFRSKTQEDWLPNPTHWTGNLKRFGENHTYWPPQNALLSPWLWNFE